MNQYKKYMDRQGVSPSLHARLTALAEGDGPARRGGLPTGTGGEYCCLLCAGSRTGLGRRRPAAGWGRQAYSMDSAGMQSAQSGAAHQGSS